MVIPEVVKLCCCKLSSANDALASEYAKETFKNYLDEGYVCPFLIGCGG